MPSDENAPEESSLDENVETEVSVEPLVDEGLSPEDAKARRQALLDKLLSYYNRYGQENGKYKGFAQPTIEENSAKFYFPDQKSATDFFKDFAKDNPDQDFILMNMQGEIVGRIEGGKLQVFDGENGFKDADENTVIPKSGMSKEGFVQFQNEASLKDENKESPKEPKPEENNPENLQAFGAKPEKPVTSLKADPALATKPEDSVPMEPITNPVTKTPPNVAMPKPNSTVPAMTTTTSNPLDVTNKGPSV